MIIPLLIRKECVNDPKNENGVDFSITNPSQTKIMQK
jgi:hypothetical protein